MTSPTSAHSFWEFRKYSEHAWFRLLCYWIISFAVIYLLLHLLLNPRQRFEYERLDKEQIQHISTIFFEGRQQGAETAAATDDEPAAAPASGPDSANELEANTAEMRTTNQLEAQPAAQTTAVQSDSLRTEQALQYISLLFGQKTDPEQMALVNNYLRRATDAQAIQFLSVHRFKVQSYFWLIGPLVYLEIMFWSWFGVLASILFNLGLVAKNSTTDPGNARTRFDSSEIPHQVAKMLYAPLCTLAIVLGYNFFSDQNIVDISSSKGVIVFAFLGGFYSSRLIAFLDRLKEVILPTSGSAELQPKATAPVVLQDVPITLELDEASIPPELRTEIAEIGLGATTIFLEHTENGETISAVNNGEDQSSSFSASGLQPGKYLAKASWAGTINELPVNLAAEQVIDIESAEIPVTLLLKRSTAEG